MRCGNTPEAVAALAAQVALASTDSDYEVCEDHPWQGWWIVLVGQSVVDFGQPALSACDVNFTRLGQQLFLSSMCPNSMCPLL